MKEIKLDPQQIQKDAFLMVYTIYETYLNQKNLQNEYLTFVQCFEVFLKSDVLPKSLHSTKKVDLNIDSDHE